MMPEEDRCRAAVRAPGFGEFAGQLLARAGIVAEDAADLDLDRKVARGPDVGAALGEQQIDFRRPAADPLDPDQRCDRLLVVGGQVRQVEPAARDLVGEAAGIAEFLPRQPRAAQRLVAGGGDVGGVRGTADKRVE